MMLFHGMIERIYKAQMFSRCDDTGLARYFSAEDFVGLRSEPYAFHSSLGHGLQGYFYSYEGYDPNRFVLFEHGFGGGHRSYMKEIEHLCAAGYRVFAYDHTGCMESGGRGARGFAQSLHDLDDCLTTLKADETVDTSDITILGHSWGGFSAMNIAALHPDVKRIVAMCGFVSVDAILAQNFAGVMKGYRRHIRQLEEETNPAYVGYDAAETLGKADTRALLIYSDNDPLVHKAVHYDALVSALSGREHLDIWLVSGKGHNPNYTADAVMRLAEAAAATKKKAKKLKTEEEKRAFRDSFDWDSITAQDEAVWGRILAFLR